MLTEPVAEDLTEQLRARPHDDHAILCSTFEFLFDFQNRIFLKILVRVSSCSNNKQFEVRGSTLPPISHDIKIEYRFSSERNYYGSNWFSRYSE
jgi:hypothetical protein